MKHLKNIKEIEIVNDIRDILLELIDTGKYHIFFDDSMKPSIYHCLIRKRGNDIIEWDDIKEYVYRIKNYLGKRYITTRIRRANTISNILNPSILDIHHASTSTRYTDINIDENEENKYNLQNLRVVAIKYKII